MSCKRCVPVKSLLGFITFLLSCLFTSTALGQDKPRIEITEHIVAEAQDAIKIPFKVQGASKRRIRVKVDCGPDAVTSKQIDFSNDSEHVIVVNLFKGKNTVTLIGFVNDEPVDTLTSPIVVMCNGRWCKEPFSQSAETIAAEVKESGSSTPATASSSSALVATSAPNPAGQTDQKPASNQGTAKIKVEKPQKGSTEASVVDASTVDSYLTIAKDSKIKDIQYSVFHGETIVKTSDKFPVPVPSAEGDSKMRVPVSILKGTNTIRFFDAANTGSKEAEAFTEIICTGEKCPTEFFVATVASSGQHSRVIVGFEQAGGSSAQSETKPFLDLFFLTPFLYDRKKECKKPPSVLQTEADECEAENKRRRLLPRFGFWGDVRLAATPDQIAAAQVFPASLVNQVDKPKSIDLVQSFDFLAGLEARIKTGNGSFLSLLPGIRQKTSLYFAFGGGAISPLTARRESVQIFNIPKEGDPRREDFLTRYGPIPTQPVQDPPLAPKEFVAIVPIDRDRFLRQWYAGFRLKTLYCGDAACVNFKNSFPAIVDFMIGQSEAVTGGSRKRGGTPDPNNPDKLIGQKNSYVLRIDGFYPLPIREANFLYLYGTALMKIGGGGVKITTPLFLDNPGTTVQLSDPRVYIPATNILKLQQPDRDYYKLGVGINLTELFNRNKPQ